MPSLLESLCLEARDGNPTSRVFDEISMEKKEVPREGREGW